MKCKSFSAIVAKALASAVIMGLAAGCANNRGVTRTDPWESGSYTVQGQGRDVGRGGATSGPVSSLDPSGNAADYSPYDEAHLER
jgi:hypothetical protein